ncbi:hypothetical protein CCACVL1_17759 [Corchorus capsularis]|uniref:Uncharacterized protein n=1 Tax=Corchorus capsularis TaxID=210143 RepID=A0A1R3HQ28_COCAP|nr:hypothetical protein CCACVL1_17759 [Corchorus capsularis]
MALAPLPEQQAKQSSKRQSSPVIETPQHMQNP